MEENNTVNYLDKVEDTIDFEKVSELIKILINTNGLYTEEKFDFEGKYYVIYKDDTGYSFVCSDGREMNIEFYESSDVESKETGVSAFFQIIFNKRSYVGLVLEQEHILNFDENKLNGDYLKKGISKYYRTDSADLDVFEAGRIGDRGSDYLTFTDHGILNKDGFLISYDADRVLEYDGKRMPSTIDYAESNGEVTKFENLIKNSDLLPPIKKIILENSSIMDLIRIHSRDTRNLYNVMLDEYKDVLKFREKLMNNDLSEYLFTPTEMKVFIRKLSELYKDELTNNKGGYSR